MNSFGERFRVTIFGESHGVAVGVVIDGVPAGTPLTVEDFHSDLSRRKSGAVGTTSRSESDTPEIVSGLKGGYTTGSPITILFKNRDYRSEDYTTYQSTPRPSHADYVAAVKYKGYADLNGGGRFSGRLTVALVAAGVVAKKIINNIDILAHITRLGGEVVSQQSDIDNIISRTTAISDSVGGVIECSCRGVAVGVGEPFFNSVESYISHLAFSIPGVRGVEFGDGFAAANMLGSEHNDPYIDGEGKTAKNGAGGVNGGISNGNDIVFRVAVKPTSTIGREQVTYNGESGRVEGVTFKGRHDTAFVLRSAVIVEAVAAIALADLIEQR